MPVTPTQLLTGTQAATIGTLHVLDSAGSPHTTDGIFVLRVDISVLAAGDAVEFLCSEEVKDTAATARNVVIGEMAGSQSDNDWWHSPPLLLANGWDFKIRQTVGTGRSFDWSIWQV